MPHPQTCVHRYDIYLILSGVMRKCLASHCFFMVQVKVDYRGSGHVVFSASRIPCSSSLAKKSTGRLPWFRPFISRLPEYLYAKPKHIPKVLFQLGYRHFGHNFQFAHGMLNRICPRYGCLQSSSWHPMLHLANVFLRKTPISGVGTRLGTAAVSCGFVWNR